MDRKYNGHNASVGIVDRVLEIVVVICSNL